MLKRKALKRIYLTTLVLFITLITFTLDHLSVREKQSLKEIEYVSNFSTTHIYLLNSQHYLVKVDVFLNKGSKTDMALEILNQLSVRNKKYNNLKGLIPSNTKIYGIEFHNKTITIDFSNDLLKVNKNIEEKVIESIVYSLLELDGVDNIVIKIEGENLTKLEKNNKNLPILLNESLGINKSYEMNQLKDTKKVVVYYVFKDMDNNYYVPVTKYVNSRDNKVKIIIDTLKGNFHSTTNLSTYLNRKMNIDFQLNEDVLTFTFDSLNEENLESVTYSLASSVFDSLDIKKVIFEVNSKIVDVKVKN